MCPTPNCSGAGFAFDIFPTDPSHPANEGWVEFCEDELVEADDDQADAEWDPDETKYKEMDAESFDEDDGEGEQWKRGPEASGDIQHEPRSEERRVGKEGRSRWSP